MQVKPEQYNSTCTEEYLTINNSKQNMECNKGLSSEWSGHLKIEIPVTERLLPIGKSIRSECKFKKNADEFLIIIMNLRLSSCYMR